MLDIFDMDDEVLRSQTESVDEFDDALKILVDAMFETLEEAEGVGLAAPQVGISKKIFVVNTRKKGERYALINPEIIETSVDLVPYEEGCLSIPGFYRDVMRPARVKVQAQDVSGKFFTLDAEGLLARVIQHENDHLNGVLFIDHLDEKEKDKVVSLFHKKKKKYSRKAR
ncbi:MAG TPA: peptide deformylase [Candidatus Ornithospirochaeta avicola]|uniref:Peptide deformylase n=1 Tax=Candidatus Ornithospirochaeta avicola TaxID=2840896 RepID=A0A9D1PS40_9SPIO|nr:peptide deformylase [Candidatus Ornithospirochaeta avicola]